jgi:hypothetical protein
MPRENAGSGHFRSQMATDPDLATSGSFADRLGSADHRQSADTPVEVDRVTGTVIDELCGLQYCNINYVIEIEITVPEARSQQRQGERPYK